VSVLDNCVPGFMHAIVEMLSMARSMPETMLALFALHSVMVVALNVVCLAIASSRLQDVLTSECALTAETEVSVAIA
jgi:hypothetical protein